MIRDTHLSTADVVRHLDGEQDASAHLAGCATCRSEVDAVRALRADARALGGPAPRDAVLAGALARRAAGERVLVPAAAAAGEHRWPRRLLPLLAAAAAVAVASVALLSTSDDLTAASDRGTLTVLDRVRPGGTVRLEYTPSALLSREPVLRVRMAARAADEGEQDWAIDHVEAAILRRDADGRYRGVMRMPDGAVFATLAVEDTMGAVVDANARRLWTLHAQDSAGRPTVPALLQEDRLFSVDDWQRTLDVARRLTTLHPDSPEGWNLLRGKEESLLGAAAVDSLRGVYRVRFTRLDSALRARPVAAVAASHMWWLAREVGDSARTRAWRDRVLGEHPRSAEAAMVHLFELRQRVRDARVLLSAYDSLWTADSMGVVRGQLFSVMMTALRSGDSTAIRRWGRRAASAEPSSRGVLARQLAEGFPALRPLARVSLLEHVRWLDGSGDARRRLDETRREFATRMKLWRAGWLGTLGGVQLAMGDARAALDTLRIATSVGWSGEEWRNLARAALLTGDTVLAVRAGAFGGADSIRMVLGVPAERWRALVDSGRDEAITRRLSASQRRRLRGDPMLAEPGGTLRRLSERRDGRITVVAFWSRWCAPSIAQIADVDSIAIRLQRQGVAVVAITDEAPSPALTAWLAERKLMFTPAHDTRGEAHAVFNGYATPTYAVLDASGMLRYDKVSDMHGAATLAEALQVEQRRSATAAR